MARLRLTRDWQDLTFTSGIIENNTIGNIEIAFPGENHGIILYPKDKHEFTNKAFKARAITYNEAIVRVMAFDNNPSSGETGEGIGEATRGDIDGLF